jgi:hypothetical protein
MNQRLSHGMVGQAGSPAMKRRALVVVLPEDEQDAIASQILASLADEDAWKKSFGAKRNVIRRMAREVLSEDEKGETLPLDDLR